METEKQDATIAETAGACLQSFNKCLALFAVLPSQQQSAVEDQLGRFSIWAANIGVFAPFRASLDYRLHGVADVQRLVRGLLRTLNEHIQQYLSYLEPSNPTGNSPPQKSTPTVGDNSLGIVIDNISEEISLLYQLLNTIRKASNERNNLKAATSFVISDEDGNDLGPAFVDLFAMEIIQRIFPDCDEKIKKRLADAMLLRRKRILYRRSRYGKAPSRNVPAPWKVVPNTSLYPNCSYVKARRQIPSTAESRAITATTLNMEQWKKASAPSIVSRSRTIRLSNHEHLEFPPAPKGSVLQKLRDLREQHLIEHEERLKSLPNYLLYIQYDGQPPLEEDAIFSLRSKISDLKIELQDEIENDRVACCKGSMEVVCPYCCCALSSATVMNSDLWVDHVKHDLDPYVCLFDTCDTSDALYNHSEDWLKHMRQHKLRWRCAAKSHDALVFSDQGEYEEHMITTHKSTRSQLSIIAARSSRPSGPIFESCPLCGKSNTGGLLENHVAIHLRYLALKSLPFSEDGFDDEHLDRMALDSDKLDWQNRSTSFGDSEDNSPSSYIPNDYASNYDVGNTTTQDLESYGRAEWDFILGTSAPRESKNIDPILQLFQTKDQVQLKDKHIENLNVGISNGQTLVSASSDQTARLWDTATGSQYHHVGTAEAIPANISTQNTNISIQNTRPCYPPPLPSGQLLLDPLYVSSINSDSGTSVVTQDELVTPIAWEFTSMPSTPVSQSRSYGCLLCPRRFRKEMTGGNFKRHVRAMHNCDQLFFCLADGCSSDNQRPDKVREHVLKFHHEIYRHPNDGVGMKRVEHAPSQLVCPQCNTQHENWDTWFACFESHCQL